MKILLPTDTEPDSEIVDTLRIKMPLKFVSFDTRQENTVYVFSHDLEHANFAQRIQRIIGECNFQGAGEINPISVAFGKPLEVCWESNSCIKTYGHDRPPNVEVANHILENIRLRIEAIIRDMAAVRKDQ